MSDIVLSDPHAAARITSTLTFLNLGTGVARIRLYGGTRRTSVTDAPGSPLLAEVELDDPAGTVTGAVLTLDSSADALVLVSGTATWAAVINGNGDSAFDCDVSYAAGTATVKIPSTTLFAGGAARLISATLA